MAGPPRYLPLALVSSVLILTSGCIQQRVATEIVRAPNLRSSFAGSRDANRRAFVEKADQTYAAAWSVPVGPPSAQISVAVVDPGDYQLKHSLDSQPVGGGRFHVGPKTEWTIPKPAASAPAAPLATVFILHGYSDTKEDMLFWALYLAQHHYRAVLVDLRGHGRSTGQWISYGAMETHDLRQVLDDTLRRGWIAGPVLALGDSYGAAMALEWAGHDDRIKSVVAISPFSDSRRAVIDFGRVVEPQVAKLFSDSAFHAAEDKAAQLAHFSWDDTNVLTSVAQTKACILFVTGDHDHWVPPENTQRLVAQAKSQYATLNVHFTNTGGIDDHVMLSWCLAPLLGETVLKFYEVAMRGGNLADLGQLNGGKVGH